MGFLLTFVVFVLIIGFLIFSHELGHFLVAKKEGLLVEEFALGFPPRIFSKKIGETKYSLNLIPFGGYVKIYGEDPDEESDKNERSFSSQKPLVKAKVLMAGVLANILVAIVIFYFILIFSGFKWNLSMPFDYNFIFGKQSRIPVVLSVIEGSPAEKANLQERDLILSVNGVSFLGTKEFVEYVSGHKEEVVLIVKNISTEQERELKIFPQEENGRYTLGVFLLDITEIRYDSLIDKTFSGFLHTANMTHLSFYSLLKLGKDSFAKKTMEPFRESTAGVVGIFAITSLVIEEGIIELFNMIALISVGLAIINILPIPALDGGRLVFVVYEVIFRKRAPFNFERNLNLIGFIFLMLLIVTITYNDIIRFGGIIKEMF